MHKLVLTSTPLKKFCLWSWYGIWPNESEVQSPLLSEVNTNFKATNTFPSWYRVQINIHYLLQHKHNLLHKTFEDSLKQCLSPSNCFWKTAMRSKLRRSGWWFNPIWIQSLICNCRYTHFTPYEVAGTDNNIDYVISPMNAVVTAIMLAKDAQTGLNAEAGNASWYWVQ